MTQIWLAVDKDGSEIICENHLQRDDCFWALMSSDDDYIYLPKGSIEKLLGYKLTWSDEPVMVEGE